MKFKGGRYNPLGRCPSGVRYGIICALIVCLNILNIQGTIAFSYGQVISIDFKNSHLEKVMTEIRKQSNYSFLFDTKILETVPLVTVKIKSESIDEVLKAMVEKVNLDYRIEGTVIYILPKAAYDRGRKRSTLKVNPEVTQELIRVSGTVRDLDGIPLPNVTVIEKNKDINGTVTDKDGKYTIDIANNGTLVFRLVGYENKEYFIQGQSILNVELAQSANQLDDIVVVGFGTQRKVDMIGSVVSVKPSDLKVPSSNLTTALAGKVAGIIGFQRSGEPGMDNADFFIRGVTTFGYKVDPLILIDNVEVTTTDLARLQVDDIASFSIMKDATATAVYGARGANGVILIQTKEGKEGKVSLAFRFENSISNPTSDVELADPITYMKLGNESVLTRNPSSSTLPYSLDKIINTGMGEDPILYPAVDWKKALIKDYTINQRYNLSVSGGGSVARYFVSGALNQDNGLLRVPKINNFNSNIDLKTYSLRSNVNINLTNTTELLVRMSGSFDDYTGPIKGGTQVYRDVMRTNPVLFAPYYEPGGDYQYLQHIMFGNYDDGESAFYLNPYAQMVRGYRDYSRSMMLAQLELKQNLSFITPGLNFRAMANTTRNSFFEISRKYDPFWYKAVESGSSDKHSFIALNEDQGAEYLDYGESDKKVSSVFYLESALNYSRTYAEKHSLSGLLVAILRNRLDGSAGRLQLSLPYRNLGLSGRFTYSYDNRYFTEFNFGYNGSERFAAKNRFGFFPSGGVAWSVSNEKFWEDIKPVINNFRIRGTYGVVGNDAIGSAGDRFYYLSEIDMASTERGAKFGTEKGYSKKGISVKRYSNHDITWETAYKSNVALELGLFNKVQFMIDLFREHRKNIFMPRSNIPTTMGLAVDVSGNVGEAMGKGVDLSLDFNHQFSSDLWMQSMVNFTYAKSEYRVYEEPEYPHAWMSKVRTPLSATWGYVAERLFIDDAEVLNSPEQAFGDYRAGDIKFKDLNGDNKIDEMDRVPLGYPTIPEINYGFGISAGYKNIDISVFFQGLARESFWIDTKATAPFMRYTYSGETVEPGTILQNQLLKAYADSYWSEDNRDIYATWPRLYSSSLSDANSTNSWFMRDGIFLRLKQAEIGYTLPKQLSERMKISKLRVYGSGTNLLLWSKFKLWDVEMAGNGLGYPLQRVFNLGIQLSI